MIKCQNCEKDFSKSGIVLHQRRKTPCKKDDKKEKDEKKQNLGQFYTTNYDYILQNLIIPEDIETIIEPFAGNGDLLKFITKKINIECYDIDPKQSFIKKRDTLLNPPEYKNKFVLTNPPYLARNKSKNKQIFDKSGQNDLYKCFLSNLINDVCLGGILIIPLNFWCSIRTSDINLRKNFLNKYNILAINIFEEKVFNDTSYSICSFQFEKINNSQASGGLNDITCYIYPKNTKIHITLNEDNNYTIGGEIYNLPQNKDIIVERLTKSNKNSIYSTNILLKCIDDNDKNKIRLEYVEDKDIYIDETPNLSARSYATLLIQPKLTEEKQKILVDAFNEFLYKKREEYNSLFLTNYRESTTIARKRISFNLAFNIVNYLLKI